MTIRIDIIHIVDLIDELILHRFDIEIALLTMFIIKFSSNNFTFFQLFHEFVYDSKRNKNSKHLFQLDIYIFVNKN